MKTVPVFTPPSLGLCCPRPKCGLQMTTTRIEDHALVACQCGYSVKEISGELKVAYRQALFVRTAQGSTPKRLGEG